MFAPTARGRIAAAAASSPSAVTTLPSFLVPAFQSSSSAPITSHSSFSSPNSRTQQQQQAATTTPAQRRAFSHTPGGRASKLGRTPLSLPPGVELTIGEPWVKRDPTSYVRTIKRTATVQGPLGELQLEMPEFISVEQDLEARRAVVSIQDREIKQQREMWGTTWSYLRGYITGVSEGHTAILRLVGVGYRATVEERPRKAEFPGQKFVCVKLGFTHPVEEPVPRGVTASTPQPTRILLEGIDKEVVMSLAARIRRWRRPEPYKGKGIFVNGETIKLKQKKIK